MGKRTYPGTLVGEDACKLPEKYILILQGANIHQYHMDCYREDVRFIPSLLPRGPGLNHSESTAYFQPGRISDYVDARRPYRSNSSHLKNELSSLRLDILAHVLWL